MLILSAIALLLFAPVPMLALRIGRSRFVYDWLIAAAASLIVWPMLLLAGMRLPMHLALWTWKPEVLFPVSPSLLVDGFSWPYALALATLTLAVILTDIPRTAQADWISWGGSLVLTGLGLLSILAGNVLTLLLAWAALDLFELLIVLGLPRTYAQRRSAVLAFAIRSSGLIAVMWASMMARSENLPLDFRAMPSAISAHLLVAAALRLSVMPLQNKIMAGQPGSQAFRRGMATLLHLVPVAAVLPLIGRTGLAGISPEASPWLLGLSALGALIGGLAWIGAENELEGQPYWILALAMLVCGAALRAQPAASIAWGLALLFSGGVLFLYSFRHRWLLILIGIGALTLSALPFTPAWEGVYLYADPDRTAIPFLICAAITQALLGMGYLRHALRPGLQIVGAERWIWLLYPFGLSLLPATHTLIFWLRPWKQEIFSSHNWPGLLTSWPGLVWLTLVGLGVLWSRQKYRLPGFMLRRLSNFLSFGWITYPAEVIYSLTGSIPAWIDRILEGDGGILWTLLLLTLLLSWLAQNNPGG